MGNNMTTVGKILQHTPELSAYCILQSDAMQSQKLWSKPHLSEYFIFSFCLYRNTGDS